MFFHPFARNIRPALTIVMVLASMTSSSRVIAQQPELAGPVSPASPVSPAQSELLPTPTGSVTSESSCVCQLPNQTCQHCQSSCNACLMGVDCQLHCGAEARWADMRRMNFSGYGPGGYAGPSRYAHLKTYRLRPGDNLQVIYLITRRQQSGEYRLTPGDEIMIESLTDPDLNRGSFERGLEIQPDGTISVRLLGQVRATGLTVSQLREMLEEHYKKHYDEPSIDVTPVRTNRLADDIRNTVGGQSGLNAQFIDVVVAPDGKIRLPGIGGLCVQGMSLPELKKEVNLRYQELVVGLETEPILRQQAAHNIYVLGQVGQPGRYQLDSPTTVLGSIALAGGHVPDANMRQVVIFRRAEDWRLISTMLDLQGAVFGKRPTPADEIWLRDGDVVIVPERPIVRWDNWIDQVFTRGVYGIVPVMFGGD